MKEESKREREREKMIRSPIDKSELYPIQVCWHRNFVYFILMTITKRNSALERRTPRILEICKQNFVLFLVIKYSNGSRYTNND